MSKTTYLYITPTKFFRWLAPFVAWVQWRSQLKCIYITIHGCWTTEKAEYAIWNILQLFCMESGGNRKQDHPLTPKSGGHIPFVPHGICAHDHVKSFSVFWQGQMQNLGQGFVGLSEGRDYQSESRGKTSVEVYRQSIFWKCSLQESETTFCQLTVKPGGMRRKGGGVRRPCLWICSNGLISGYRNCINGRTVV